MRKTLYLEAGFLWLLRWLSGKESACHCRRRGFDPWVRKISWSRKWQPALVFLPGKFHGQRNLMGYSPWARKESDNEYSGLISFRIDWLDLLAVQGTRKSLLQHHSSYASILWHSTFFIVNTHIHTRLLEKP